MDFVRWWGSNGHPAHRNFWSPYTKIPGAVRETDEATSSREIRSDWSAVERETDETRERTSVCGSVSAPCRTRILAAGTRSSWAARCSAVRPLTERLLTAAPRSNSSATMSACPSTVARWSAVNPFCRNQHHYDVTAARTTVHNLCIG